MRRVRIRQGTSWEKSSRRKTNGKRAGKKASRGGRGDAVSGPGCAPTMLAVELSTEKRGGVETDGVIAGGKEERSAPGKREGKGKRSRHA